MKRTVKGREWTHMIVRDDQLPLGAGTTQDEVPALPAASVLVLRGQPYEVLLLRRHEGSRFVPGAWVFPGGVLEPADEALARRLSDGGVLGAMRVCAARELFEESGIWLGRPLQDAEAKRHALLESETSFANLVEESAVELDRLTWTARWITPIGIPRRYDTWFFLVEVEASTEATAEEREGMEAIWIIPDEALERHRRGELSLVFPTIRNLEAVAGWMSPGEVIASRLRATIETTRPVLVVEGDRKRIVLPEE
ncbi:MAG TPA: NUDIX hydrolase [Thermoanaerobaculia bacterium]|nr:NUDIX hydrolase [Thermoanaerobaculia bacterium]